MCQRFGGLIVDLARGHRGDIASALGQPPSQDDSPEASVEYVRRTLDQRGVAYPSDGVDPYDFVMAGTGRIDPASIGLAPEVDIYG